jgi:hypothetical protein
MNHPLVPPPPDRLQCRMSQIRWSCRSPCPPELAPDLVRAMQAPGPTALLSRTSPTRSAPPPRCALPHELWLGPALGRSDGRRLSFAAAAMRGFGLDPAAGTWFIVHPAHIEIARSHLAMADMRRLGLVESHARALFDSARPFFDETGNTLLYGDARTWFMRADAWTALDTASPDAVAGMNLTDWLPTGPRALDYRKLQNDIQLLRHQHPANVEREARGFAAINGFWPWGAATLADVAAPAPVLAGAELPPWLAAIAGRHGASFTQLLGEQGPDTIFCDASLAEAALAADWAGWLAQVQKLDHTPSPAAPRLTGGAAGKVRCCSAAATPLPNLPPPRWRNANSGAGRPYNDCCHDPHCHPPLLVPNFRDAAPGRRASGAGAPVRRARADRRARTVERPGRADGAVGPAAH